MLTGTATQPSVKQLLTSGYRFISLCAATLPVDEGSRRRLPQNQFAPQIGVCGN